MSTDHSVDHVVVDTLSQILDLDEVEIFPERYLDDIVGWDSVNSLRVLVFLERELRTTLDVRTFLAAKQVRELTELAAGSLVGKA